MKARWAGSIGDQPIWSIESEIGDGLTSPFQLVNGVYSARRYVKGRSILVSAMHPRYANLRARIDAAIVEAKADMANKGGCNDH